jgi:hypothetical protein
MDVDELVIGIEGKEIVKIVSVQPLKNYKLRVKLSNGQKGIFDVSKFVGVGVFKELKDPKYFRQVSIKYGTVVWPNEQDIDPELIEMELQLDTAKNNH